MAQLGLHLAQLGWHNRRSREEDEGCEVSKSFFLRHLRVLRATIYLLPGLTAGIFAKSGGNFVRLKSFHLQRNQTFKRHAKIHRAVGTIHHRATPTTLSAVRADDIQSFLHAPALGHDILYDENFFARRNLESTPQNEFAFLFFHEDEPQAQAAARLPVR